MHTCCRATYVLVSHSFNTLVVDQVLVLHSKYLIVVLYFEHIEYDVLYGIVDNVAGRI